MGHMLVILESGRILGNCLKRKLDVDVHKGTYYSLPKIRPLNNSDAIKSLGMQIFAVCLLSKMFLFICLACLCATVKLYFISISCF